MLSQYLQSKNSALGLPFIILLSSVIGGATIAGFPKQVIGVFSNPIGQFIAFYFILYRFYVDDDSVTNLDIFLETIIYVLIIQSLHAIAWKIYPSN